MSPSEKQNFMLLLNDTAELYGKTLSPNLLNIYWEDLKDFSLNDISSALKSHRKDQKAGAYMPRTNDILKFLTYKDKKYSGNGCGVRVGNSNCGKTQGLINIGTQELPTYWCENHYLERNLLTPAQLECQRRANVLRESAKNCGMSNYDFCREVLIDNKTISDTHINKLKEILSKQNPLYENVSNPNV
jgi:hypothetical protein